MAPDQKIEASIHAGSGQCELLSNAGTAELIERGYLGTLLAPDIVEAALSGRGPELTVARGSGVFPVEWEAQCLALRNSYARPRPNRA